MSSDDLNMHAPYRYASGKEQRSFNKPWLTKSILFFVAKKEYSIQKTVNYPNIIRQYKTYINKLTHLKGISNKIIINKHFKNAIKILKRHGNVSVK